MITQQSKNVTGNGVSNDNETIITLMISVEQATVTSALIAINKNINISCSISTNIMMVMMINFQMIMIKKLAMNQQNNIKRRCILISIITKIIYLLVVVIIITTARIKRCISRDPEQQFQTNDKNESPHSLITEHLIS